MPWKTNENGAKKEWAIASNNPGLMYRLIGFVKLMK